MIKPKKNTTCHLNQLLNSNPSNFNKTFHIWICILKTTVCNISVHFHEYLESYRALSEFRRKSEKWHFLIGQANFFINELKKKKSVKDFSSIRYFQMSLLFPEIWCSSQVLGTLPSLLIRPLPLRGICSVLCLFPANTGHK